MSPLFLKIVPDMAAAEPQTSELQVEPVDIKKFSIQVLREPVLPYNLSPPTLGKVNRTSLGLCTFRPMRILNPLGFLGLLTVCHVGFGFRV